MCCSDTEIIERNTFVMIELIEYPADHVAAFRFSGEVTKADYDEVVFPTVKQVADKYNEVNMIMVLDTEVKNMSIGAWMDDALLGLKNLTKWNKIALVSDEAFVKNSVKVMDKVVPGTYRCFEHENEAYAFQWVSAKDEV